MHTIVRNLLFNVTESWLSDTQVGGRPKCGVDMASHVLKSFIDIIHAFKLSGVCLLIDIKAAFYSVLRPLLYETGGDEDAIARMVLWLGLPHTCVEPLLESLRRASVLEQAGASPHLLALCHGLYNGLWWQVKGHDCLHVRGEGSAQALVVQIWPLLSSFACTPLLFKTGSAQKVSGCCFAVLILSSRPSPVVST